MAVSLSASLPPTEATCSKGSFCPACFQSSLGCCASRGPGRACMIKHSQNDKKLRVAICRNSSTFTEVSSCPKTSLSSFKLAGASFTHDSCHNPSAFLVDHSSRPVCAAAVATIASENHVASDQSTIVFAAEQAMAFAAAALDAAKHALEFHEGEHGFDCFSEEHGMLKLEKPRLSELLKSRTSFHRTEVIISESGHEMSRFVEDIADSSQRSNLGMESDPGSTEMSEALYNFRKVLEETFSGILEQESEEWCKEMFSATVVVKSTRRKERTQKRENVQKRVDKIKQKPVALHRTVSMQSSLSSVSSRDTLGGFLKTIKKKRLLTSAEEKQLSGRVQFLLKAEKLKAAFKNLAGHEPAIQELAKAAGMDANSFQRKLWAGRQGKARMIYCNLGLVISVAKRFQGQGIPLQDLVQEGVLGLMRAIEKFKPSLGFKLSTYAHWWIFEAISRAVNTKSKAALVPVNVVDTLSRVHKVRVAFSEEHGRPPTEDEVAKLAKLSLNRLRAIEFHTKPVKSADRPVGRDDFSTLGAFIVDETSESYQAFLNRQYIKEDVEALLLCLSDREKQIVKLRFPADGRPVRTLEDIGATFNLTRERIRQIERIAMQKLKCPQGSHLKSHFGVL